MTNQFSDNVRLNLLSVFVVLILIYVWSMPRTVVLEDDSYFVLAAYYNGVAHPPGYPLYTVIAHLFSKLPVGTVAFRVHLCSAFFAASACVGLWWISRFLTRSHCYAWLASVGFGVSAVFWSQSIIAEVYTLNVFLFVCLLLFSVYFHRFAPVSISVTLFGVIYGFALANHWPLIVLSSPGLFFIFLPYLKPLLAKLHFFFIGLLLGLLPYAWMVINSQAQPFINFYGPITSWSDFWFYVSREAYAEQDISRTAGLMDKFHFAGFVCQQIFSQFGIVGVLLGLVGFVKQWRTVPCSFSIGLTLIFIGNTFLLIGLLGFDYDLWHRNVFRVYPLIAYAVYMLWIVIGLQCSVNILTSRFTSLSKQRLLLPVVVFLLIVSIFPPGLGINYRANDTWAEEFARTILLQLEPKAVLFTHGDFDQGALVYTQRILGQRADVSLYNGKGVLLSNRLFYPTRANNKQREAAIATFIQQSKHPVYYTYGLPHPFSETDFGLYRQINKNKQNDRNSVQIREKNIAYLSRLIEKGLPADPWESMHYQLIVNDFCKFFFRLNGSSDVTKLNSQQQQTIDRVCHLLNGKLMQAEILMRSEQPDWSKIRKLLDEAMAIKGQAILKSDTAKLYFLIAEKQYNTGDINAARANYQQSISIWPDRKNLSYARLKSGLN